jgi:hypothetical protein
MSLHLDEADASARSLEYAKPQGPTRRQFSLLILLIFINTILFAAFVCLPAVTPFARQTWGDYQKRKADRQLEQQRQAMLQQVKSYTAPANDVVYEEDPAEVQKLLDSGGGWESVGLPHRSELRYPIDRLTAPIIRRAPQPLATLQTTAHELMGGAIAHSGVPFVHARKDPNGREYLAGVWFYPRLSITHVGRETLPDGQERHTFDLRRELNFTAYATPLADAKARTQTIMHLLEPEDQFGRLVYTLPEPVTLTAGTLPRTGKAEILQRPLLRVFAGQPDPNDPAHFTVPYQLNGRPGVIDGFVRTNGRVMLQPRDGQFLRWKSAHDYDWDLAAPPTTLPVR